jgi:ribosome-binding factor A
MKSFERREKVARAIMREVSNLIQQGAIKDDRLNKFVSIVEVDMNTGLSSAKVLFSVMNTSNDIDSLASLVGVKAALNEHSGYIRGIVGRKLNLKYAPKLIFVQSESLTKAVDLVDLIDKTVERDDKNRGNGVS